MSDYNTLLTVHIDIYSTYSIQKQKQLQKTTIIITSTKTPFKQFTYYLYAWFEYDY